VDDLNACLWLVCGVQNRLCALPLEHVVETLRPLPIEPLAGLPPFVLGLAVVRGAAVPVVDAACLLGAQGGQAERFVIVVVDKRRVALAVDSVLGVRRVAPQSLNELPPLLREADTDVVAAVGLLDAQLLLVLRTGRLLPEEAAALVLGAPP